MSAWSRETRGSAITRSLSTLRPTLNGVRLRTMFRCSFPCTSTSAGNTPELEDDERPIAFKTMEWSATLAGGHADKHNDRNHASAGRAFLDRLWKPTLALAVAWLRLRRPAPRSS